MFFGGSFGGSNVYVRRGPRWERHRAEAQNHHQVNIVAQLPATVLMG